MKRIQLWSCGGGRQSAGLAALIVEGELPRPDHVMMTALEWERKATFQYVNTYIRPAMLALGIPFTFVSRKKYAKNDFFGGENETTVLIPVYTNQSGNLSKFSEFCSGKWKHDVSLRWAAEQPGWKQQGVDNWIGISRDEGHRRRSPNRLWNVPVYPLLDIRPTTVAGCLMAVARQGWPDPPRSRCEHCPNQSDAEWDELDDDEWERACKTDEMIREVDPHAFLHKSLMPLRMVKLDPKDNNGGLFGGGCTSGMCY